MIELSSRPHLQDNIDIDCVVEAAIHLDDIGMVEEHLDLDLSGKLIGDFLLMQQLLLDHLQSAYEIAVLLLNEVDSAVFSTPELLYLDEVINADLFLWFGEIFKRMELGVGVVGGLNDHTALHIAVYSI